MKRSLTDRICALLDEQLCLLCDAKSERNAPRLDAIKLELDTLRIMHPRAWAKARARYGLGG
jgi:hypothetical protein